MKRMLVTLVLCLAFGSAVLSAPNVVVYRYQGKGFVSDNAKWPVGKKTALLLHGFSIFSKGKCRDDMVGLAGHLSVSRRVGGVTIPSYDEIYAVEYPPKYHILDTASVLSSIVNSKCSAWPKDQKIDVFAHSMGGLVARTAIEYPEVLLGTKNISNRVGHLVTMGTPHNGISSPVVDIFKEAFGELPVEVGDMDPQGLFMNMLNFTSSKKPQVSCDYYSIVGARSYRPKKYLDGKTGVLAMIAKKIQDLSYPVHDGLIDVTSAGFDLTEVCHAFKKAQLDLNHDYINNHPEVFSTIDRWMIEDKWFSVTESAKQPETTVGNLSGLAPQILLGKSRAEIEKILGDTVLYWEIVHKVFAHRGLARLGPGYYYPYLPSEKYNTFVSFIAENEPFNPRHQYNQTRMVSISFWPGIEAVSEALDPDQIVPAEVLNAKPFGVYRMTHKNTIAVVWYLNKRTFLLILSDVPSRPLYTTVQVNSRLNKYYKNKNTTDFHHGRVYHFAYADKVVKLERFSPTYGGQDFYHFWINVAAQSGMNGYLFDK